MKNKGILLIVVCAFALTAKAQNVVRADQSPKLKKIMEEKRFTKTVKTLDKYSIVKKGQEGTSDKVEFEKPLRDPKRKPLKAKESIRKQ